MSDDNVYFSITNPVKMDIGDVTLKFQQGDKELAEMERYSLETLADLWLAGGPHTLERIANDAWLSAAFFRLCRAGWMTMNTVHHTGVVKLNANSREQSAITSHALPA